MDIRISIVEGGRKPVRMTDGSAGFDCYARSVYYDGKFHVYNLGFAVEIPDGYVGLVFPRSSVYKTGMSLTNCVGVIDSDFRGEVTARFIHRPYMDYRPYSAGDRVCQIVFVPVPEVRLVECDTLSDTERGEGGYGSTGVR